MTTPELILLCALVVLACAWFDAMRAREHALQAAREATAAADCQLLDAAVALASLRLVREDGGMLRLRRVYRFEFSDDGERRLPGTVTLYGARIDRVDMAPRRERAPVWTVVEGGRDRGSERG